MGGTSPESRARPGPVSSAVAHPELVSTILNKKTDVNKSVNLESLNFTHDQAPRRRDPLKNSRASGPRGEAIPSPRGGRGKPHGGTHPRAPREQRPLRARRIIYVYKYIYIYMYLCICLRM